LNLLHRIDCVDRVRTNGLVAESGGEGLLQLVIETGRVGGSHIFRASGLPIVADELVKAAFDEANIVGAMWYQLTTA
jgi:hypothetical protein